MDIRARAEQFLDDVDSQYAERAGEPPLDEMERDSLTTAFLTGALQVAAGVDAIIAAAVERGPATHQVLADVVVDISKLTHDLVDTWKAYAAEQQVERTH